MGWQQQQQSSNVHRVMRIAQSFGVDELTTAWFAMQQKASCTALPLCCTCIPALMHYLVAPHRARGQCRKKEAATTLYLHCCSKALPCSTWRQRSSSIFPGRAVCRVWMLYHRQWLKTQPAASSILFLHFFVISSQTHLCGSAAPAASPLSFLVAASATPAVPSCSASGPPTLLLRPQGDPMAPSEAPCAPFCLRRRRQQHRPRASSSRAPPTPTQTPIVIFFQVARPPDGAVVLLGGMVRVPRLMPGRALTPFLSKACVGW
jgi:hypothetical protein